MKEATLQRKVDRVNEVASQVKACESIVVVNCIGLTVAEVSELRTQLYEKGCRLEVIKNNILTRACQELGYNELTEVFKGPSAIAFSSDAFAAAKVCYAYAKTNKKLEIKAGVVDGTVYNVEDLKVISSLPDKNGMLSMLLSVLQAPIRNLGCAIKAVADQQNA